MSYAPTTDFLALIRNAASGVRIMEMPGLDFVVSALARAGMIRLSVGQTAPIVNQLSTAWFRPALPSYSAEGMLFLYNAATQTYELATPVLWFAFLSNGLSGYSFQLVITNAATVLVGTSLLAVRRAGPSATSILLPNLVAQWNTGRRLQIVDFSSGVVSHTITLTTPDGATIMQLSSWQLLSSAGSLAGIALQPSPELNSWIIAP